MRGIWGSYYNIPRAIFYLLKGDYIGFRASGFRGLGAYAVSLQGFQPVSLMIAVEKIMGLKHCGPGYLNVGVTTSEPKLNSWRWFC